VRKAKRRGRNEGNEFRKGKKMNASMAATSCGRELDSFREGAGNESVSGVFPHLVNRAAFVDKLTLGVDGELRRRIDPSFTEVRNPAIGGPGRPYARSLDYIYGPTGNPFELKYGANRMYPGLFDMKLILRSEKTAISPAEVGDLHNRLFRKGHRISLRGIEFTFDVSIPFSFFEIHILTRARSVRTVGDDRNRQTLYAGAPGAPWMLRVYQKTRKTTRVEYVLRHPLLAKAGVKQLENIGKLKELALDRMVRFPAICQRGFEDLIRGKFNGKRFDLVSEWPGHWYSATLLKLLKDQDLNGRGILRVSAEEQLLRKMQDGFKW
jgi:hypothetical protein